ncbi:MAG: PAS domain-containing protein [Proteobacteria bacterium]|nr:PAS domain-containing protein [Pseudomonadota bacterium]
MAKKDPTRIKAQWPASPVILLSAVVILLVVVAAFAGRNISRDKQYMSKILLEKGAALIRSFEAGTRTGMMGSRWGEGQIQTLIEETARQEDILYIAVCGPGGRVLAHSNPARIGEPFHAFPLAGDPASLDRAQWRVLEYNGIRSFEVFRHFRPLTARFGRGRGGPPGTGPGRFPWCMGPEEGNGPPGGDSPPDWCFPDGQDRPPAMIFVGLDVAPFAAARSRDMRITLVIAAVLLLLGFGGMVSLFRAENYRNTRRLLQDKSAFADVVVASLPVGLVATDPDGRVVFFNDAAGKTLAMEPASAMGRLADDLLPAHVPALGEFLYTREPVVEQELAAFIPGRGEVPLSVSAVGIENESGGFVGRALILRDLTDLRRLEDEIRRKDKMAALGGLAAGVAHEIRNPLSSIKGLATYFGSKFGEDSEDREAARVMVNEVERLNRAVTQLLEFARPADIKAQPTDVNALVEHSLRLVKEDARARGVTLRFDPDSNLPSFVLDPDRLAQCLLNLYLNALDAMEQGGVLTVNAAPENGGLALSVTDTGRGMDPTDLDKIFDPYYTTKASGTGLGLAVVHKIVESHHGRVRVVSRPGRGTVFTISLPAGKGGAHA